VSGIIGLSGLSPIPARWAPCFCYDRPRRGENMKQPVERRLAAILAADVAGYSRLMGADEEGTHERLRALIREVVDPTIQRHRGRVVKNTGDGMLVEFASVVDAVRCAVEVQHEMARRNPDVPTEGRIEFRVGINLGDVIADGGDIFGDGVNVAARLEALAEPGGICISRVVRDQVRDKFPYLFEDLGEQSVKNIARPIRVYALRPEAVADLPASSVPTAASRRRRTALAAMASVPAAALVIIVVGWWLWPATRSSPALPAALSTALERAPAVPSAPEPAVPPRLSIVVLPFTNLSNDPEQQYFADGITDDLTTDLSRIAHTFVISRNTAFSYKDKPVNAKQIARELGVRYVLEGSVRRSGNHVRVNVQLIDAETSAHLWAERFDSDTGDLFVLQNEITGRLSNALDLELTAAEVARPTDRLDALDYILRGYAELNKGATPDNFAQAIDLFEHALAIDPRSVEAQSSLAVTLVSRVLTGMTNSRTVDIGRAKGLIGQSLAISPRSTRAHFARGLVLRAEDRCDEAIPEFETVIVSNRNSSDAFFFLGLCKLLTGSMDETIPLEEQAIRLSPRDPYVFSRYLVIGQVHLLRSRTEEAIVWLERARTANPSIQFPHAWLASAYALIGDLARANAELAQARRQSGGKGYSSILRMKTGYLGVPFVRALHEATYFAGLRKAGVPEE
jgi:adenylate cyclase